MSDTEMKYEDWLRGCVHHDGRKGNVYLPCDAVLAIADWIEAHRYAESVVRCKDCKKQQTCNFAQYQGNNGFCSLAEQVFVGAKMEVEDETD